MVFGIGLDAEAIWLEGAPIPPVFTTSTYAFELGRMAAVVTGEAEGQPGRPAWALAVARSRPLV